MGDKNPTCSWCNQPFTQFKNKLSKREFKISGLCQECQNKSFKKSKESPKWLTENLKMRIKNRYEPKYQRQLTDQEVEEIADNLADLVSIALSVKSGLAKL